MGFRRSSALVYLAGLFLLSAIGLSGFGATALADERIGSFQIEELILRPMLAAIETEGGEFSLSDSSFALGWNRDSKLSARVGVGSTLLRYQPIYYAALNEDKLGFYEAYAQYESYFGRFRFGLIPLNFGYDAVVKSSERYFKRALPYTQGLIGVRDYGMSFETSHKGYYTQLTAHNGEVDTPSDGRMWVSGNWGYTNDRNIRAQLSMQTGFVTADVSDGSSNTVGGVDNTKTAHWRNALFFVNWHPRNWNVVLQVGGGEVEQGQQTGRYSTNMAEVTRLFSKNFGVGVRYDQIDPNRNLSGDQVTEASLLCLLKSDDSTSEFYLLGTKVIEESGEVPNDELRLVWLLTPYSR